MFANRWGQGPGMRAELCPPRWMASGWPRPSPRDDRPLRRGPAAGGARDSAYKRFCGAKTLAETRLCRVEHFNRPRGSQRFGWGQGPGMPVGLSVPRWMASGWPRPSPRGNFCFWVSDFAAWGRAFSNRPQSRAASCFAHGGKVTKTPPGCAQDERSALIFAPPGPHLRGPN